MIHLHHYLSSGIQYLILYNSGIRYSLTQRTRITINWYHSWSWYQAYTCPGTCIPTLWSRPRWLNLVLSSPTDVKIWHSLDVSDKIDGLTSVEVQAGEHHEKARRLPRKSGLMESNLTAEEERESQSSLMFEAAETSTNHGPITCTSEELWNCSEDGTRKI